MSTLKTTKEHKQQQQQEHIKQMVVGLFLCKMKQQPENDINRAVKSFSTIKPKTPKTKFAKICLKRKKFERKNCLKPCSRTNKRTEGRKKCFTHTKQQLNGRKCREKKKKLF